MHGAAWTAAPHLLDRTQSGNIMSTTMAATHPTIPLPTLATSTHHASILAVPVSFARSGCDSAGLVRLCSRVLHRKRNKVNSIFPVLSLHGVRRRLSRHPWPAAVRCRLSYLLTVRRRMSENGNCAHISGKTRIVSPEATEHGAISAALGARAATGATVTGAGPD